MNTKIQLLGLLVVAVVFNCQSHAGQVVLVGNGASTGPVITTSSFGDISLGTRLRVGTFTNVLSLNTAINNFLATTNSSDFTTTVNTLNSLFVDFGSGLQNAGTAAQAGTGISTTNVVFNTTASITNSGFTNNRNVFNGQISNVSYTSLNGVGSNAPVYIWTAFSNEIGIFKATNWITPSSDLTGLTLNLSAITASNSGASILLGGYKDWATGNDYLTLAIPEPDTGALIGLGIVMVLFVRYLRLSACPANKNKSPFYFYSPNQASEPVSKAIGLDVISVLLVIAVTLTGSALHAQTVSTPIVGFYKKSFPAGGSLQTSALIKATSFQGTATGVTGSSLSCSSASWIANQFAGAGGFPAYYVEITSGPLAGYSFDVISNTINQVSVDAPSLSSAGSNPSFIIREHRRISEIFSKATNLNDYQDQVTIYNSDGTTTTLLRDSSSASGWIDATTFSTSDPVLYPAQGFVLTTQSSGQITVTGQVNPNPTVVPLYANQPNIVSLANPGDVTRNIQNVNLGAQLSDFNDQVAIYSNDGSLAQTSTLLWAGVTEGFYDATAFTSAVGVTISGSEPVIVTPVTDTAWYLASPLNQ